MTTNTSGSVLASACMGAVLASVSAFASTEAPMNTETFAGVRQEAKAVNCTTGGDCYVFFNPVPAGGVKITNVSCNWWVGANPSNVAIKGVELQRWSQDEKSQYAQAQHLAVPYANAYGANYAQFQILANVLWGMPGGWRPTIHIFYAQAVASKGVCTISGPSPV